VTDTAGRRTRTINQALVRPETVAGAEKIPLGIVVTTGVFFGFSAWQFWNPMALLAALAMLFGGVPLLRRIAKSDPQMFAVYRANLGVRGAYPARSPASARG